MTDDELNYLTANQAIELFRSRVLSPVELLDGLLVSTREAPLDASQQLRERIEGIDVHRPGDVLVALLHPVKLGQEV